MGGRVVDRLSFADLGVAVGSQCRIDADSLQIGREKAHPDANTHLGRGFFAVHEVQPGLTLTASAFTADREISGSGEFDAGLFIVVLIEGGPRKMKCADVSLTLMPGSCHVFSLAEPTAMHSVTPRGAQEKMICVRATQKWLASRSLLSEGRHSTGHLTFPLPNDLASSLGSLFVRTSTTPVGRLNVEALTLTLLSAALDVPERIEAPLADKIIAVRRFIDADPCGKHTLHSLSAAAGLSVTTLKTGFPELFGTTVFGYIRGIRMETARAALASRRWSVSEAAYAVGYNHPASFSTAYRRHFGHSPKAVARSTPVDLSRKKSDL